MSLKDDLLAAVDNYVTAYLHSHISIEALTKYRQRILDVVIDMDAKVMDAFFEGYNAKHYYYDDEITNVLEEWKKYNEI